MPSVRVVTFNTWNDRHLPDRRLEVAIDALRALAPDVIGLQEVVGAGDDNQAARIARALGADHRFDAVDRDRPAGALGNAIVSRFPIRREAAIELPSSADDPRRALLCVLGTPEGELPFATCHLSWEMHLSPRREAQVVALDAFVRAHPADLPPVITGDFNASPDAAAILFLTGRMGLAGTGTYYRDCYARRRPGSSGHTWSERNPYAVRWIERNRRLDYVFVGAMREDGWGAVLDARIVLDLPGHDGVFPSDHFGVFAELGVAPPEEAV